MSLNSFVFLAAPFPTVTVNTSANTTEGSPFTASCLVNITSSDLLRYVSVEWISNQVIDEPDRLSIQPLRIINETHVILDAVFSSLFLSDTGTYTCVATIGGAYLTNATSSFQAFLSVQGEVGMQ